MLSYQLEQAPYEAKIIDQCMREKRELPPKFRDAPVLETGLELYWGAWSDLHGDRGGMGDGLIPWGVKMQWADRHGLDARQAEDLHYLLRALDYVWLEYQAKQRDKK